MIGNVVDAVLEMVRIVELALALITVGQQRRPLAFVKLELFGKLKNLSFKITTRDKTCLSLHL